MAEGAELRLDPFLRPVRFWRTQRLDFCKVSSPEGGPSQHYLSSTWSLKGFSSDSHGVDLAGLQEIKPKGLCSSPVAGSHGNAQFSDASLPNLWAPSYKAGLFIFIFYFFEWGMLSISVSVLGCSDFESVACLSHKRHSGVAWEFSAQGPEESCWLCSC